MEVMMKRIVLFLFSIYSTFNLASDLDLERPASPSSASSSSSTSSNLEVNLEEEQPSSEPFEDLQLRLKLLFDKEEKSRAEFEDIYKKLLSKFDQNLETGLQQLHQKLDNLIDNSSSLLISIMNHLNEYAQQKNTKSLEKRYRSFQAVRNMMQ